MPASTPAKLTQPLGSRIYPRQRLFNRLDEFSAARLIWVSAPAGYGKTTLASSYLRARDRTAVWYQCDESDADIASFFFNLRLAFARVTAQGHGAPPIFSTEHFSALDTFTCNFFRASFAELPVGGALVFDNYQAIKPDSALHGLLPTIAEQIPAEIQLIVISRQEPTPSLSRLIVHGHMAVIATEELMLSRAETEAVALLYSLHDDSRNEGDDDTLHTLTQGWAAGLMLLLRRKNWQSGTIRFDKQALQNLFDYLAAEIFDGLDAGLQSFLLKTSLMEHFTVEVARQVSGNADAAGILVTLVQQNAFTTYHPEADSYHYHPLFRAFLHSRFQASVGPFEQRALMSTAAHALSTVGDAPTAIGLLLRAECWTEATSLICLAAPEVVQQARLGILAGWIDALPPGVVAGNAWITYWRGIHQLHTYFLMARITLEQAHALFESERDILGQMLSCAAILQHIGYCYADFQPMIAWIDKLEGLIKESSAYPSPSVELQIAAGFVLALCYATPGHPDLISSVRRVFRLICDDVDFRSRATGVAALLHYFAGIGKTTDYGDLDNIAASVMNDNRLAPILRLQILWLQAYHLFLIGDTQHSHLLLHEAHSIAQHHGLKNEQMRLRVCELQGGFRHGGDGNSIEDFNDLNDLEPQVRTKPPIFLSQFLYVRAMFELAAGRPDTARKYAQESLLLIRNAHWPLGQVLLQVGFAEIYCALGRFDDAAAAVRTCRDLCAGLHAPIIEFNGLLMDAQIARHTKSHQEFLNTLGAAFEIGRRQGYANCFHAGSQVLRRLVPHALKSNIESSYCRSLIGKLRMKPPSSMEIASWPWPVRIMVMGSLEVVIDDGLSASSGKSQRKPLELLKYLLTGRQGWDNSRLMDLLWQDLEGDSARNALDLAVHRLRKLLRHKDAVLSSNGRLMLNTDIVWVDAFALENLLTVSRHCEDVRDTADYALQLYRAPFLTGDDTPEFGMTRDRLRSVFLRIVDILNDRLKTAQNWRASSSLCLRAIEVEPLEEALHRELIRGLLALGHDTEARVAYERCAQILARNLGRSPSSTTQLLMTAHLST